MLKKILAEFVGTFWLVLGGCGSAVLAAKFHLFGIGFLGVSIAFGLTLLTMCCVFAPISGCHLNPAVSIGLWAAGQFKFTEIPAYIVAQVVGAVIAAVVLYLIANGQSGFSLQNGFASNGYGAHSPGHYSLFACFICEFVMTGMFVLIITGVTNPQSPSHFAPLAIGMALALIHLISIPVTNTSVNPARSTGPAILVGGWAIQQLWLFWLAPILGGLVGGSLFRCIWGNKNVSQVRGERLAKTGVYCG
jgi:aquaporin Z